MKMIKGYWWSFGVHYEWYWIVHGSDEEVMDMFGEMWVIIMEFLMIFKVLYMKIVYDDEEW